MSVSAVPEVVTCEGFRIPVGSPSLLCVDRVDSGRYCVAIEEGSTGVVHRLAELDSFRDALDARKALGLLITVLFPTLDHPSNGGE